MRRPDFVPRKNVNFHEWQGNLFMHASSEAARWKIPPEELEALAGPRERWVRAFGVAMTPATRTAAANVEKDEARVAYEAVLRLFIKGYLAYNKLVTDADRKDLGLPLHDRKPTPVAPIVSRPELQVKFGNIQEHVLVVRDNMTRSAGKPAGAAGFEIWRKVGGELPSRDEEWSLVGQATRSPHVLTYPQVDSGKRVYYRLRWVNTRGVPGPWSEPGNAVIA
jgi:hypothetical protein